MATYSVNETGVKRAEARIKARQYVVDSDWGDVQPSADDENAFLEIHSWTISPNGISGSRTVQRTKPRPVMGSCTGTFGVSIARA